MASLGKEKKMKRDSESLYLSLFPNSPLVLHFSHYNCYITALNFFLLFCFHSETQHHDFSLVDTILTFYRMHFSLRIIL